MKGQGDPEVRVRVTLTPGTLDFRNNVAGTGELGGVGLFLPLVIYAANRKKFEGWPGNPYLKAKAEFLDDARRKLVPFYKHVRDHAPDHVTFGVGEYSGDLEVLETESTNRQHLISEYINNNCTLLIAHPRDILRTKREIEDDNPSASEDTVNRLVHDEIRAVKLFLERLTPFIFVPGFSFSPYRKPFSDDSRSIEINYRNFFDNNMGLTKEKKIKYTTYDKDGLKEAALELAELQMLARFHIMKKLEKIEDAAAKRI